MLNKIRILTKIVLCISVIITFSLTTVYFVNLRPDMDGLLIYNMISRWVYGENGWTVEMLFNSFAYSAGCTVLLFIINTALDIAASVKSK